MFIHCYYDKIVVMMQNELERFDSNHIIIIIIKGCGFNQFFSKLALTRNYWNMIV